MSLRPLAPLLLALWLAPAAASAWPVDLALALEPGRERFHRLSAVEWVEVQDPEVASAELLPGSNELLLTGRRPGRTLLLLYAEGTFAVWRLEVRTPGERPRASAAGAPLAAARAACPGLQAEQEGERQLLRATVRDAACRGALLGLARGDLFLARELELTFELAQLQAQLAELTPGLAALGLRASYRGAGLVLEGRASPAAHRSALWQLFQGSLGRVALEDRVQRVDVAGAPDAGQPLIEVLPPGTTDPSELPTRRRRPAAPGAPAPGPPAPGPPAPSPPGG